MGTSEDDSLERLREDPATTALLFDVDGTLAPITRKPEDAAVPDVVLELLRALADRYALVACVSGRRARTVREMTGLPELTYLGNHGYERLEPDATELDIEPEVASRAERAGDFLDSLEPGRMSDLGILDEDKGAIHALHWRGSGEQDAAEAEVRRIGDEAEALGLVIHWGRKVLEIRPLAGIDKGTAIAKLLKGRPEVRAALYAGDDRTDLDAFRALREMRQAAELDTVVCVGVASAEGPDEIRSEADVVIEGPPAVVELLRELTL